MPWSARRRAVEDAKGKAPPLRYHVCGARKLEDGSCSSPHCLPAERHRVSVSVGVKPEREVLLDKDEVRAAARRAGIPRADWTATSEKAAAASRARKKATR